MDPQKTNDLLDRISGHTVRLGELNQEIRELVLNENYRENDAAITYFGDVYHQMVAPISGIGRVAASFQDRNDRGRALFDESDDLRSDHIFCERLRSFRSKASGAMLDRWDKRLGELPGEVVENVDLMRKEVLAISELAAELFPHLRTQLTEAEKRLKQPIEADGKSVA